MFKIGRLANMKKLIVIALSSALLTLSASPVQAVNKEGAKCTTAGKIVKVASKRLVCARVAKGRVRHRPGLRQQDLADRKTDEVVRKLRGDQPNDETIRFEPWRV